MNNALLAQIAELPTSSMPRLKALWKELYQKEVPVFNRNYLVSRLTYRLQELAWDGELDLLNQRMAALTKSELSNDLKKSRKPYIHYPPAGTKLVRNFKDVDYHVTVLQDGFAFNGRKYRSLSRISQLITGMSWSGPEFFGLVSRKKAS